MAETPSIPVDHTSLENSDDLKLIRGIGPAVERRLNDSGIHTYAQISEMSNDSLASLLADMTGFSAQRIEQRDWIGQARQLASEKPHIEKPAEHQHYAVFSLELLLDEHNHVRRTRAANVQSQKETAWAGWDLERLAAFFAESAGLSIETPVKKEEPVAAIKLPVTTPPTPEKAPAPAKAAPAFEKPAGDLRVSEINLRTSESASSQRLVHSHQAFTVSLKVDLSQTNVKADQPLNYAAMIFAKRVTGGPHLEIGRSEGQLKAANHIHVEVPGMALPDGAYRIEAVVTLKPGTNGKNGKQQASLTAMMEGGLLQVY